MLGCGLYSVLFWFWTEDDASPEHASSGDVGAPAAAHAGASRDARTPPNAAASASQGEQARNTD